MQEGNRAGESSVVHLVVIVFLRGIVQGGTKNALARKRFRAHTSKQVVSNLKPFELGRERPNSLADVLGHLVV